ncbi:unnamed protein product [Meloidogyne enterolobii]|uniref:Uncharacterized protein n=1 Tax=Meloidogyne enterolobii TaxID=390850 RepID=A0ACB0YQE3_MELEN
MPYDIPLRFFLTFAFHFLKSVSTHPGYTNDQINISLVGTICSFVFVSYKNLILDYPLL